VTEGWKGIGLGLREVDGWREWEMCEGSQAKVINAVEGVEELMEK